MEPFRIPETSRRPAQNASSPSGNLGLLVAGGLSIAAGVALMPAASALVIGGTAVGSALALIEGAAAAAATLSVSAGVAASGMALANMAAGLKPTKEAVEAVKIASSGGLAALITPGAFDNSEAAQEAIGAYQALGNKSAAKRPADFFRLGIADFIKQGRELVLDSVVSSDLPGAGSVKSKEVLKESKDLPKLSTRPDDGRHPDRHGQGDSSRSRRDSAFRATDKAGRSPRGGHEPPKSDKPKDPKDPPR